MSFTITTDVFCDNCSDWTSGVSEGSPNRTKAWLVAKSRGWTKVDGKHLCPLCNGKAYGKISENSGGGYLFKEDKEPK